MYDIKNPPVRWPKGYKSAACFTFDLDAETHWISKDPTNINRPGVLSMGTYGPKVGVPMILNLLQRHKIKSTFFVPGWTAEQHPDVVRAIVQAGHEIAHHGYLHESLEGMTRQKEEAILCRGLDILAKLTTSPIVGYRAPSWDLTPHTLALLKKHKFIYASNLMDSLWPYRHPGASDVIELPVQWLLDDGPFFAYGTRPPLYRQIYAPGTVYSAWKEEFVGMHELGALYNLTMHPQFTGRPSRINMLDKLVRFIKKDGDVWITTCRDIAEYVRENPAATPTTR
jgi:peptidoglycan-N-acetylglucosamine deacetylase